MELERIQRTYRNLEHTHHLLTHLHGELAALRGRFREAILVLRALQTKADRDELTGLLRRTSWRESLRAWFQGENERADDGVHFLVVDVDHFKRINDRFGHAEGDRALQALALLLASLTPLGGILAARFGGEEFVLAVRGRPARALAVAEWIRRGVHRLTPRALSVSVGVALRVGRYEDLELKLGEADRAMYEAKLKGRNRVLFKT